MDLKGKTIADKLISNDDTQNYPFCRLQIMVTILDTQLNKLTNQNSIKVVKPTYRKTLL